MEIQEAFVDQSNERRRTSTLMEAVRKFSRTKLSTPRLDQIRKPFFTLSKSSKVNIQPWPSATNLTRFANSQKGDANFLRKSERASAAVRRAESFNIPVIDVRHSSLDEPDDDDDDDDEPSKFSRGIVNSAFSQEKINDSQLKICDVCGEYSQNIHSELCHCNCGHEKCCQHFEEIIGESRKRLHSYPKVLAYRRKTAESPRWKKGVRWKTSGNKIIVEKKSRRRTVDSVPSPKKFVASSRNSLNLSNSENNLSYEKKKCACSYKKESTDDDDDSPDEESHTKL